MPTSLDLTLPEPRRTRSRPGLLQVLTFLAVLAALAVLLFRGAPGGGRSAAPDLAEAERLRRLGEDLEKRHLYAQADEVWAEYARAADLSAAERAEVLFRRGLCLKGAGRYAEAARRFTEVETLPLGSEKMRRAHQLLLECLTALGKLDARAYVSRLFATGSAPEKGTTLARVGDLEITKEELRERLAEDAERVSTLQGVPMTPAEIRKKAEEFAEAQLRNPEATKAVLEAAIREKLLYLEALRRNFADDETTARALSRLREGYLAQRVLEAEFQEALKALGPTELSNHYAANKEKYVEKPSVEFSRAAFATEAEARSALEKMRAGDAEALAALERAPERAFEGEPLPGIGWAAEAAAHLFALEEGALGDRPIEANGRHHVFRVEKKHPARQLTFAEAEPRVRADLASAKRDEALKALGESLARDFGVEIVPEFEGKPAPSEAAPSGERAGPPDAGAKGGS